MNVLLILVIALIVAKAAMGYKKGFLRVAFHLVEGIVAFVLVVFATPYVSAALIDHTSIDAKIEAQCEEYLYSYIDAQIEKAEAAQTEKTDAAQENLSKYGIAIPEVILIKIGGTGDLANQLIENSGVVTGTAEKMTNLAMRGISFSVTLILVVILLWVLSGMLGIVEKIPIINGSNRMLGMAAGAISGFILVWIAMAVVAFVSATGAWSGIIESIQSSSFLLWLYENNLILNLIMRFF